jgi:DNA-binding HxlR family transcriptional regulator
LHYASTNIQTTFNLQVVLTTIFMDTIKKRSDCPLSCSLDIFGDKWSLLIIRDLMFNNKSTYGDFLKSAEGIATNILASRLQGLEENGIIEKLDHPNSKAKILYRLTQKGIDLLPILIEVYLWAEKYLPISKDIKARLIEAKKDKETFIKFMTKELKKQLNTEKSS